MKHLTEFMCTVWVQMVNYQGQFQDLFLYRYIDPHYKDNMVEGYIFFIREMIREMRNAVPAAGIKGMTKQLHPTVSVGCDYFSIALIPVSVTTFFGWKRGASTFESILNGHKTQQQYHYFAKTTTLFCHNNDIIIASFLPVDDACCIHMFQGNCPLAQWPSGKRV